MILLNIDKLDGYDVAAIWLFLLLMSCIMWHVIKKQGEVKEDINEEQRWYEEQRH